MSYEGPNVAIAHVELMLGAGMVMLGSLQENDYGKLTRQPDVLDACETQFPYIVVPVADAVLARVKKAGCVIVLGTKTEGYGGAAAILVAILRSASGASTLTILAEYPCFLKQGNYGLLLFPAPRMNRSQS